MIDNCDDAHDMKNSPPFNKNLRAISIRASRFLHHRRESDGNQLGIARQNPSMSPSDAIRKFQSTSSPEISILKMARRGYRGRRGRA